MGRALLTSVILVVALALSWAGTMMYVAWEHNPQGRFHENGIIHWDQWLIIGGTHFVVAFVAALPLMMLIWLGIRLLRTRSGPVSQPDNPHREEARHGT